MARHSSPPLIALLVCILSCVGLSPCSAEDSPEVISIKEELKKVRTDIRKAETQIKIGLEPSPEFTESLIEKLEYDLANATDDLKKPDADKPMLNARIEMLKSALRHYKTMREFQKLDKDVSTEGIAGILLKQLQESPYAKKYIDPLRDKLTEFKEKEQQLNDELAKLTGETPSDPKSKLTGDMQFFEFQDNKYLQRAGFRAEGDRAELTLFLSPEITQMPKGIRDFLGWKQQLTFPARKVGIEYHVDGKEYREFVSRQTKIFTPAFLIQFLTLTVADKLSDTDNPSNLALDAVKEADATTKIDLKEAKLVVVPIDDNLFLTSYMHAVITGTVDGKTSKEVVGLDETGKPQPWKFVLYPVKK